MQELKQIANGIIDRGADFVGEERRKHDNHPFFRQISGICNELPLLEEAAGVIFRCKEDEDCLPAAEKARDMLVKYQASYKRDVSDIIRELDDYIASRSK